MNECLDLSTSGCCWLSNTDTPGYCLLYEAGCTLPRHWVHLVSGQAAAACLLAACVGQVRGCSQYCSLFLSHTHSDRHFDHTHTHTHTQTHTLSWSHSVPLTLHIHTHNLVICSLFSAFHFLLSCAHKSSKSSIPRHTVTTFSFLADTLYICGMVCVCVVTPFPHCIPLFQRIRHSSRIWPIPPARRMVGKDWKEQVEFFGKCVFAGMPVCVCVCVCVCVYITRVTLIETWQISSRYSICIHTATI